MEPGVVSQEVRAAHTFPLCGQEQGEDADDGSQTGDIVWRLAEAVCDEMRSLYYFYYYFSNCSPLLSIPDSVSCCCLPARLERTPRVFLCWVPREEDSAGGGPGWRVARISFLPSNYNRVSQTRSVSQSSLTSALPSSNMWILNLSVVSQV